MHIAGFALGGGFAWLAFKRELGLLGAAFSLFGAAELVYLTYHLDWTVFLFAHTVAEVLDLTAFALVFAAAEVAMVKSYRFEPKVIEVAAGDTVTWTNEDNFTHTVRVDRQDDHEVEHREPCEYEEVFMLS